MSYQKRNVFLFGAGAVIDWGAPTTKDLTDSIVKWGFKAKDGKTITFHIKDILERNGHSVNFETILSVIEELIVFYAGTIRSEHKNSLMAPFLSENNILSSFLNYSVNGDLNSRYFLNIPNNELSSDRSASSEKLPNQFFFESLLTNLLSGIEARVEDYNYHSETKSVIENQNNKTLNDSFSNWIKDFVNKKGIVRLYSLNYDRLNKVILENRGVDVFEGFNSKAVVDFSNDIELNLKRIINDTDCICNYNLHGCANWKLKELSNLNTFLPFLTGGVHIADNYDEVPSSEVERGKSIICTNIIAGYQKAQRSVLSPYKQMQAAFDRDCLNANNIFIIGYSFSDEHINESIKMTLIFNKDVKIHIIDCGFWKNLFSKYHSGFIQISPYSENKDFSSKIRSIRNTIIYDYKFKDFLIEKIKVQ
jgi:hypothetical protein